MIDFLIQEQGSGGDIIIRNNDVVTVDGLENQPYAAQWGGSSWLFNDLFLVDDQKFTAQTEQVILNTPLNSAGLVIIQKAMLADLEYLTTDYPGTVITVVCSIPSKNRLNAKITINGQVFIMQWNPDESFLTYTLTE